MNTSLDNSMKLALRGECGCVSGVEISWSPLPIERLLIGQRADDADALIPAALALCHEAHCAAAQQALDAAADVSSDHASRDERVHLEAGRETLRRWLLDFPAVFGEPWPEGTLPRWRELDTLPALMGFCAGKIFGDVSAVQWLRLDAQGRREWAARGATPPARWLRALLQDADRPVNVAPANVLDYARQQAEQLLLASSSRGKMGDAEVSPPHADLWAEPAALPDLASGLLIARLRHLARICVHGEDASMPASGSDRRGDIGIGWAHTARGLLLHLARVEQGKVTAYRIIPPTYWNFGAATLLTPALADRLWHDAQRRFERLVLLLDPCVPFEIPARAVFDA